jgi:hypothetical protein
MKTTMRLHSCHIEVVGQSGVQSAGTLHIVSYAPCGGHIRV